MSESASLLGRLDVLAANQNFFVLRVEPTFRETAIAISPNRALKISSVDPSTSPLRMASAVPVMKQARSSLLNVAVKRSPSRV